VMSEAVVVVVGIERATIVCWSLRGCWPIGGEEGSARLRLHFRLAAVLYTAKRDVYAQGWLIPCLFNSVP